MQALAAGCHVLGEKPISNDIAKGEQLVAKARAKGVCYGINLNHRFTPAARVAKRWMNEGRLGHLLFVNMAMWIKNPAESSPYFQIKALHPHTVDVMRYFCGDIEAVQCFALKAPGRKIWSTAHFNMRFKNGVVGGLTGSYDIERGHPMERCEVAGTGGRFVLDDMWREAALYPAGNLEKTVFTNPVFGGFRDFEDTFRDRIHTFLDEVTRGVKPENIDGSGADGLAAQKVLQAAIESLDNETVVRVWQRFRRDKSLPALLVSRPMNSRAVNIAVIGWGNFFKHIHEQTVRDMIAAGRCRLRAVCVRSAATRDPLVQEFQADYGTPDYRQVLADPQVEAVLIGAPHGVQALYSLEALRAGKWVYVEKPMFADEAETGVAPQSYYEQFQALGQPALQRLAVGLNKRFAPAYRELKELAPQWGGFRCIRMSIVDDAWRWGAKYPTGFLMWLDVCHWLDLARWFTGAEVEAISCLSPQVEDSLVTMKMADGSSASIFLSGNGTMDMIKDELHVTTGKRTCASVFDYVQREIYGRPQRDVRTFAANLQSGGDLKCTQAITAGGLEAFRAIRREMFDKFRRLQATPDPVEDAYLKRNIPNFMRPQGWRESLWSFVDAVAGQRPLENSATYRDAYISCRLLEATGASLKSGGAFVPATVV